MAEKTINLFPPRWIGLDRVRNAPYIYKDRWPEAPFGERWRRLKERMRRLERLTGVRTAPADRAPGGGR